MKKVLMVATIASTIGQFNMANIAILQSLGYEVSVACDFTDQSVWTKERVQQFMKLLEEKKVVYYQINFSRNPINIQNVKAYRQLIKIIKEKDINLLHCHTPVAGAISRIVAKKTNTKVIYTAHGFHFFKGAPLKNWLLFYPIEKWLSKYTDVLITINKEDYKRAKTKFHAKSTKYIPGVGIDLSQFNLDVLDMDDKRKELGVRQDEILLLSVGELNKNKNHELVIRAIHDLNNPNIRYFIAGKGDLKDYLVNLISELGLDKQVKLLGYRDDVAELYQASDLFVFPSKREGLPVALMEAIASKVPVMCSNVRGNNDLVKEYLFDSRSVGSLCRMLKKNGITRIKIQEIMGEAVADNFQRLKRFSLPNVSACMSIIYQNVLH